MRRWLGITIPLGLSGLLYFILPASSLSDGGRATAAVTCLMVGWWITEVIPIAATALLPVVLFPLLGAATIQESTAPYGNRLIFLFLGGFLIAVAMVNWNLHKRVALHTLKLFGATPATLIGGFMLATAFLSMWISNTAVTVMMLPIALSLIELLFPEQNGEPVAGQAAFPICLLLAIAYAASVGGLGTLIGTPPNALLAAFLESQFGEDLTFRDWMPIGLPLVFLFLPLIWLLLTRVLFRIRKLDLSLGREMIAQQLKELGPMRIPEKRILSVFCLTASLWILRPYLNLTGLNDSSIAIFGALLLFILPSGEAEKNRLLTRRAFRRLPWGVLLLFGGGLSIAAAMEKNGVAEVIGQAFAQLQGVPPFLMIIAVVTTVIFLTEIMSNTAATATLLPILTSAAHGMGLDPHDLLIPTILAVSCAFMLPVATPPNAIIFASGHITVRQMARTGLLLNLCGILLISLYVYFFL